MTEWFSRKPGDVASQGTDDPTMLLIGDGAPDWVRLPPELGGAQLRVLRAFGAECPMCRAGAPVRHLEVENNYGVAECAKHGFVWYHRRNS